METQIQQDNGEWASWGYVSNIVDMAPVDIILESKATKERKEKFRNRWKKYCYRNGRDMCVFVGIGCCR